MNFRFRDLVRWGGTVDRKTYLLVGVVLTLVKLAIDRTVAARVFGREWTWFHYIIPGEAFSIRSLAPVDREFYLTMVVLALPFIWIGVTMTMKRLRDVAWPTPLVAMFFLPMPLNMVFFLALGLKGTVRPVPQGKVVEGELPGEPIIDPADAFLAPKPRGWLDAILPEKDAANAAVSILLPLPFALGLGALSVRVFENYGWGVFVGLPFVMPMISVLLYSHRRQRGLGECLLLGLFWFLVMFLALAAFALEGIVCLILLAPLALPIVLMGATAGYLVQLLPRHPGTVRAVMGLLAVLPALIGAEGIAPRRPPLYEVTTAVEVDAPPRRVWEHVVRFSTLPPPDDWVFRTGVAYPLRAEITGEGPGAVRRCVFSTGAFVEPIEVWDAPRLLRFAVTENPPPMKELSPFAEIHPPHLDNYLVSRRGQFLLVPLPGGRTRLEGTTWYHHNMWPAAYWRVWSDRIIRRIHLQVLRHVKRLAEAPDPAEGKRLS